jgi:hypothetical protein
MKTTDAVKILMDKSGSHLDKIYIPSLGREILFYPLSTADVKTLTRMSFIDEFDISVEGIKLALFDKLCTEDLSDTAVKDEKGVEIFPAINAKTITIIDYLAFTIGIRQMLNNDLTYKFTCYNEEANCDKEFEYTIQLDKQFDDIIFNFKRQREFYEKIDEKTGNIWKFELTNFSMYDYLYFRFFMNKLQDADIESPDVEFEDKFTKPILYIKNIWFNDQLIEDWPTLAFPDKLSFWNKIPPNITINSSGTNFKTLADFCIATFWEEKLQTEIEHMQVQCPYCKKTYNSSFRFDDFFSY